MYLAVGDPDFQMGGGGGRRPHFRLKIRGVAPRVPPLDPTLPRSNLPVSFSVSIILKQT